MKVVILAGGYGTRISEESCEKPKPMIEIGGKPVIWHIMKLYSFYGYNEFIICCGYKGHIIKEYFANYYLDNSDFTVDFSNNNKVTIHNTYAEPWKITLIDTGEATMTGGRIKRIEPYTDNTPFFLTYGDGVSDVNINALLEFHKKSGKKAIITTVQPDVRFGYIDIADSGRVLRFDEKAEKDVGWINAGFMVIEPGISSYIEDDITIFEREPMEMLVREKELSAYKHTGFWQCMDTMRDKKKLEDMDKKGGAPWKVWEKQ